MDGTPGYVEEEEDVEQNRKQPLDHMSKRLINAVRGTMYDLKHWDDLPPVRADSTTSESATYILTRDERAYYLSIVVALVIFVIAIILALMAASKPKPKPPTVMYAPAVVPVGYRTM